MEKMKGLELSRKYVEGIYLPFLKEEFPELLERMAIGLAGEGSECFGFDDEISRDHDFGPSCCIWLMPEDFEKYGVQLEKKLRELPKEFMGFPALVVSEYGDDRRGVLNMNDWYYKFLGMEDAPENLYDWRLIPENSLATVTNGEVFFDNLGKFTEIRDKLKKYFPEDIRRNKIATRCMKIAQSGQYNFLRCMQREEFVAARLAETEFISEAIHMIYLLNKEYLPFYKWQHRGLKRLKILGFKTHAMLNELVKAPFDNARLKVQIIEKICGDIIEELKNQNLVNPYMQSDFLQDYGPLVQQSIQDEKLRNWPPMLD